MYPIIHQPSPHSLETHLPHTNFLTVILCTSNLSVLSPIHLCHYNLALKNGSSLTALSLSLSVQISLQYPNGLSPTFFFFTIKNFPQKTLTPNTILKSTISEIKEKINCSAVIFPLTVTLLIAEGFALLS